MFDSDVIIATKMRFCNEFIDKKTCDKCNNQVNENKDFEATFKLLKRHFPNKFAYMLPIFKA